MDRIDLVVQVRALEPGTIADGGSGIPSSVIRESVLDARRMQLDRNKTGSSILNSGLEPENIKEVCPLGRSHRKIMEEAVRNLGLTARGFHRILRVARTIADLEGSEYPEPHHLAEALQYRPVMDGRV
jgi:magnesium chelatase family protein